MLVGSLSHSCCVCLVVSFVPNLLAEVFVVNFVAVRSRFGNTAHFAEFLLCQAHRFNCFVSKLYCIKHFGFADLIEFAFYHHNVFVGSSHNHVDVGSLALIVRRINLELTVDAGYAHFRNRAFEWKVGDCERCRSCKTCKCIGSVVLVGRKQVYIYEYFCVEIAREQWTQCAVNQT